MKKITLLFLFFSLISFAQKAELKKEISKITEGKKATVAVSVLGIDFPFNYNNENAEKKLPLLSVFKFHIALATLNLVENGKLSLNQKIFIGKNDLHEKTWSPLREKLPDGNFEITLSDLLKYMVAQSDNNATDKILTLIGGTETVQRYINTKGIKNFQIRVNEGKMNSDDWKSMYENWSTTKSLAYALKKFSEGKIISKSTKDFLMNVMLETTTGTNKIVEQLPKGTPVAHRTGSSGKVDGITIAENDIAIITLPNGKYYAIAILVSDSSESYNVNCKMISDISKVVYNFLDTFKN